MAGNPHYRFRFGRNGSKVHVPGQPPRDAIGITYQRPPIDQGDGTQSIPPVFPALYVSPYVQDPTDVARRICAILEEHWKDEDL